jgi:hypothetical protein
VAFETNCRSVPVPFALLSKRTARSLVSDLSIPKPKDTIVQCIHSRRPPPSTCSAGTAVFSSTLISATHTRSVCGEVASRSVSRQGERIRSPNKGYEIPAGQPPIPEARRNVFGACPGPRARARSRNQKWSEKLAGMNERFAACLAHPACPVVKKARCQIHQGRTLGISNWPTN